MMSPKNQELCSAALKEIMKKGESVLAFICIRDGELHAFWCGQDDERTAYYEQAYARSILEGPGIETVARYKTKL